MNTRQAKILVADDDAMVRSTVSKILEMFGHQVVTVADGSEVINVVDNDYNVIILDINMPGMDGFETIKALNDLNYEIPVLFLTGAGSMDYAVKAINLGAYDFLTKPIGDLDIFNVKIRRAIEKRMYVLKEQEYKASLEDDVKKKTAELQEKNQLLTTYSESLEKATVQLMSSLQNAMEEKDYYTAGYTMRVTEYALMLGRAMDLNEDNIITLRRAAQFHDIGKLVIDLSCIQKPGKLTDEEWVLIKKHPSVGANIIKPLGFMEREGFIIRHHHERMDGKGYPDGLVGEQLDPLTKILIVVDSYDAMTSRRNYRRNLSMEEALSELYSCSGTQFDPETVEYFAKNIAEFSPTQSVFQKNIWRMFTQSSKSISNPELFNTTNNRIDMKITREEVEHVAHLARLNLNENELVKMTEQLDNILSYVDKLEELDTKGIKPTTHAFDVSNAFREDAVKPSLSQKEALANAREQNGESFVVPRVI